MKKLILGIGVICLFALVVFAASSGTIKQAINKEYSNCMKGCTAEKKDNFILCKDDFSNSSTYCKTELKTCLNNTNETLAKRNCSKNYLTCKKETNSIKTSCLKEQTAKFMVCKDSCKETRINCIQSYEPVCGIDGLTYPNLCTLNLANVSLAYEGKCNQTNATTCNNKKDCPEIICVKSPCPVYDCVQGVCVVRER